MIKLSNCRALVFNLTLGVNFFCFLSVQSQNCYVQLSNMSGFDTSPYLEELEAAACALKESLPLEYQNDFKVFDFEFYRINEFLEEGFESSWQQIIEDVQNQSPYYLLFGKISTRNSIYSGIKVDYKMPEDVNVCLSLEYFVENKLSQILNQELSPFYYASREIKGMEAFLSLECEICNNEIDDDADGYIDCYDLDCILINGAQKNKPGKSRNSEVCYSLTESCINSIVTFIENSENDQWMKENLDVFDWGLSFMAEYGCTKETGSFVIDAFNLKKADEGVNLDRIEELYLVLKDNPNALLENCPDFDLQTYSDLLNLQVPNSIVEQLNSYGLCGDLDPTTAINTQYPCFSLQTIEEGSSALVNMDYYAVEITQIPDFNGDGSSDTKEQLYQKFRENFTELVSGMTTVTTTNCPSPLDVINASWTFLPYQENIDLPLWELRSIGARFFIDANAQEFLAKLIADDGAIITIQENEMNFIVSTIYTPRSLTQPFSGKRMWGVRTNSYGNCEIYTRAIDRAKPIPIINLFGKVPGFVECDDLDYFDIADRTWINLQSEISQFISANGGAVTIKEPSVVHLDFKQVYEKLKSNTPVNFISCQ